MKTFVIGDIHGSYKALLQCLERCGFDVDNDRLIVLGDVCDGYPDVRSCIDALLKIRHCDLVIGNHDQWALDWALRGDRPEVWNSQGGSRTIESYGGGLMPEEHVDFLQRGRLWIEFDQMVSVHGGFKPGIPFSEQTSEDLLWDRDLLSAAIKMHRKDPSHRFGDFDAIFLGHTTTQMYASLEPIHACNVWAMDTGAGWSGKLTIMDVNTKKFWQSDLSSELYGGIPGRME